MEEEQLLDYEEEQDETQVQQTTENGSGDAGKKPKVSFSLQCLRMKVLQNKNFSSLDSTDFREHTPPFIAVDSVTFC